MPGGIYTALSGAIATQRRLDVLSHNLANVNSAGFKSETMVFREIMATGGDGKQDKSFVAPAGISVSHKNGALMASENPLDCAIEGRGFFAVKTPAGERLTRNGAFRLSSDGTLVNSAGHQVQTEDGKPIKVIDPGAKISIGTDGTVRTGEEILGKLKLVYAKNPEYLGRQEGQYFVPNARSGIMPSGSENVNVSVLAGQLESANINAVTGMTDLITVQRHFELTTKAIQVYEQIDSLAAREIGKAV
ncbi:flagellar basal-body rod protein FlgF [Myxococcota bacterium]|nr:flagellar basal-body rod protein FlgF [Myxococcota bacterium]MBU1382568.1 flagellar basal-body rod protein FlgF [Myxococcota bacterium]MBU1498162.1 flagellar basal-body rod protein FlgF [Myxococcota bacterium]